MGLFDRLLGRSQQGPPPSRTARRRSKLDSTNVSVQPLHGTGGFNVTAVGESGYQRALWRAIGGKRNERVREQVTAVLIPEVNNQFDEHAVAVFVSSPGSLTFRDNNKVAYLSRKDAEHYQPTLLRLRTTKNCIGSCDAVIVGGDLRSDGQRRFLGIWLDLAEPDELLTEPPPAQPEPTTSGNRKSGARSSQQSTSGFFERKHYTDHVEDVKQLKRDGSYEEVSVLLFNLLVAVEAEAEESGVGVAPWYYEQLAILLRKQGDLDGEVAIIERFAAQRHAPGAATPKLLERLEKARARQSKKAGP